MKLSKLFVVAFTIVSGFFFTSSGAQAQFQPDVRIGAYSNGSFLFIGGGFRTPLAAGFHINPTANYVFIGNSGIFFADIDAHYDFASVSAVHLYAGPGISLATAGGEFAAGLNLLLGVGFKGLAFEPYIQPTIVLGGGSALKLSFGARF